MLIQTIILCAALAVRTVIARCPNSCNGHGSCGISNVCTCYSQWDGGAADCSARKCNIMSPYSDFFVVNIYFSLLPRQACVHPELRGQIKPMHPILHIAMLNALMRESAIGALEIVNVLRDTPATPVNEAHVRQIALAMACAARLAMYHYMTVLITTLRFNSQATALVLYTATGTRTLFSCVNATQASLERTALSVSL